MGRSALHRFSDPRGGLFAVLLAVSAAAPPPAAAQQSAFSAQLASFARDLSSRLAAEHPSGTPLVVADFDDADDSSRALKLGYAVSELITEDIQRGGHFLVLEKKQLNQLLKTMELQLSGLYDSDKAAAVGKLVDARLLMVGSVAKAAGFYRVSVRVMEVETGAVVVSGSTELDAELLEAASLKYRPPRFRFSAGSSLSWFALTEGGIDTYSIGVSLGWSWEAARAHWLSLQAVYFFGHYGYYREWDSGDFETAFEFASSYYRLVHAAVLLAQYGYRLPLSRTVSAQANLGIGAVVGALRSQENYYRWTPSEGYADSSYDEAAELWARSVLQFRLDLVFLERQPVSFYIGAGAFLYAPPLSESHHGYSADPLLGGLKLEAAALLHF